jgi:hypothetical protein
VVERGAAGLLYDGRRLLPPVRDRFDDPDSLAYTSFWWQGDEPRGWGFVLSRRAGARLREGLAAGRRLELEAEIESRRFATTIPLLSARLPGTHPGEVLIVSHLCHPQPSANDNASGAAANLETARTLMELLRRGALADERRSVRFLWMPEHSGTYAWLGRDPRRARDTVAALNLDMVGQDQERCGSTFLLEHPPCFAASFAEELMLRIREQAVDWIPSYSGPGHYSGTRMGEVPYSGGSDHVVFIDPAMGVPCPMLIQWPDRYYHSSLDTPDKTSPASLALTVRCAATYAGFLAAAGPAEREWLLQAVGRGARRRLLKAADAPEGSGAGTRERLRGKQSLATLARIGVESGRIDQAQRDLSRFAEREGVPDERPERKDVPDRMRRVPARALSAPLHYQRFLLEGWSGLPREAREEWRRREQSTQDGLVLADLAWYACDGRRSLDQITGLVALETGRHEPDSIEQFFESVAQLGFCTWIEKGEVACSPDAPHTAGR